MYNTAPDGYQVSNIHLCGMTATMLNLLKFWVKSTYCQMIGMKEIEQNQKD